MNDDKIRAILHLEADSIEPSPAGWDAIQEGIARSRPRVWWTRGAALAGAAALVVGATVYVAADRSRRGVEGVPTSPGPEVTATATSTPPEAVPQPPGAHRPDEPTGGIWPLTTYGEVAAWHADQETYPALRSPRGSALAFARHYLGFPDVTVAGEDAYGESTLQLKRGPVTVATVTVQGLGKDGTAPFVVIGAGSPALGIWEPRPNAALNGSFLVRGGAAEGIADHPIRVYLRVDGSGSDPAAGQAAAVAERTADGWQVRLQVGDRRGTGSLLVVAEGPADGRDSSAAAIPVTFGGVPGPPVLVAARGGRIALVSKATGEVDRWLTEATPGAGASDPELAEDGRTVVYVQSAGACSSEIRSVPVTGGRPTVLVRGDQGRLAHPTRRGDVLAYVRTLCAAGGDTEEVVVRNGDLEVATWQGDVRGGPVAGGRYVAFTGARDGGAPALRTLDGLGELPGQDAAPPAGCGYVAAAWGPRDAGGGELLYVATDCGGTVHLDRVGPDLRDPVRIGTLGVAGVESMDFAGADLLVGAGDRAYVADPGDAAFPVPGRAQRPGWH